MAYRSPEELPLSPKIIDWLANNPVSSTNMEAGFRLNKIARLAALAKQGKIILTEEGLLEKAILPGWEWLYKITPEDLAEAKILVAQV